MRTSSLLHPVMRIAFIPEHGTLDRGSEQCLPSSADDHREFKTASSLFRGLKESRWNLVVAGWDLPDVKGDDLLRWMRATFSDSPPVVFLTSHDAAVDIVNSLEQGAVDYILAPVEPLVLRARLGAILRLLSSAHDGPVREGEEDRYQDTPPTVRFGRYVFHQRHHYVDIQGEKVMLRPKEYALAMLLFENIGKTLSRESIHMKLWETMDNFPTRTLDTHLSRLRAKLKLVGGNGFDISQIRGVGYRLESC
ncbi:response regulator transcription factor [Paraburkholderia fungorum]|uniref:response regulator transcription factor n=1 Tax=Paraburkholderia fungorum TaxID=134537 RepID=UPI0038B7EEAA